MRINWKYLIIAVLIPVGMLIIVFTTGQDFRLPYEKLKSENESLKTENELFEHAILEHSLSMLELGEMSGEMRDFKKIQEHLDAVIYLETVLIEHYKEIDDKRKESNPDELIIGSEKK